MLTQAVATGDYLDTGDFAPLSLKGRLGWVDVDDGKHFEWDVSAYEPRTQSSPTPATTTRGSHTRPAPRGRYDNFRVLARTGGERRESSSRVCSFEEIEDTRRRLGDVDPFDTPADHTEPAHAPATARIDVANQGTTGRRRAELVAKVAEAKLADAMAAEADAKAAEADAKAALEAAIAEANADAKARESSLSARIDEDDPFAAAAAAGVSSHVSSSSSPPSSSSLFFNDGGMFGAARDEPREPEPPPSDEPDEDRKLAMSVQLTQQFSGELARLGLRVNDEIIRALKASNWDHYDAHEALDNLTRELGGYQPDEHEHEQYVPGVSGYDGGGYADPIGQGNDDGGEDFDYKALEREQREVQDGTARRATLGPAPVAPSDPSGDWRRPASDVLKVRQLCREFPRLDADVVERSLYEVYRGNIDSARHALTELEGQMLTKERKERMAESNRLAAASGASGQPKPKPGKAKQVDITREVLGGATYLAGGGRYGSAREFVSSIMDDHTDDDEAKIMNEVRERQGGGGTGDPSMDRDRGPAGQRQDIARYHDELTVLRRSLNSLRAHRSNAVARKDHDAANGLRPEIDKLMKDIDFKTAKVNKLAAMRSSNANTELARVDLHGMTERGALERVLTCLSGALSMSYGGLKVITGAGNHSGAGGPVLRMMVTNLLNRHKVNYVYSIDGGSVVINW